MWTRAWPRSGRGAPALPKGFGRQIGRRLPRAPGAPALCGAGAGAADVGGGSTTCRCGGGAGGGPLGAGDAPRGGRQGSSRCTAGSVAKGLSMWG